MGNPNQGEVSIEVDGTTYIGKLDIRAHRSLEHALGVGSRDVLEGIERVRIDYIIAVLYHALRHRHPNVTEAMIEAWIEKRGFASMGKAVGDLIRYSSVWRRVDGPAEDAAGNAERPTAPGLAAA